MKFGVHLTTAGANASRESILEVAQEAERLSYESVWMFDHLFTPVAMESTYPYSPDGSYHHRPDRPYFDCVAVMGALAAATSSIRFGTLVMVPGYRHPVVLAKLLASIDALAGGRMTLGVAGGWMEEEYEAVGLPAAQRLARLDEHVALMRNAWQEGVTSFSGELYSHRKAGFHPQPPQPGNTIPVIVGGHGDSALRRAARWGDGWAVVAPGPELAEDPVAAVGRRLEKLRSYCEEEGRSFEALLLVGQAPLDSPVGYLDILAEAGVDTVDLRADLPKDALIDAIRAFASDVMPQFAVGA